MTLKPILTRKSDRGFTIVELLIVIIVIGILATLVLIGYSGVQGQARDAKRKGDSSSLRDAAASFKAASTNSVYPTNTPSGFQTDISTAGNYSGGAVAITVDSGVTNEIVTGALATVGPTSSNKDVINASYCGAVQTAVGATGMNFIYWSEVQNKAFNNYTGTGTCAVVAP